MMLGIEEADAFKNPSFIKVLSIEKCLIYLKHGAQSTRSS